MIDYDAHGTLNPAFAPNDKRFVIYVDQHDPCEEDGWTHKLRLVDHKYLDSDGLPIDSVPAGNSWAEAFRVAGEFVDRALSTDHCIF